MLPTGPRDRPHRPKGFPRVGERTFQDQVVQTGEVFRWAVNHVYPLRTQLVDGRPQYRTATTMRGWVDLTLIRPPRIVFMEVKGDAGRLEDDQRAVLALLAACPGVEAYVVWPWDLNDIIDLLRGPA